jgi:hypothetical protein
MFKNKGESSFIRRAPLWLWVIIGVIIVVGFLFVSFYAYEVKNVTVGFPPRLDMELEKKPATSPSQKNIPVEEKKSLKEGDTSVQIQQHTRGERSPAGVAGRSFTVTVSFREDQRLFLRPICGRVIQSIRM